MTIKDINKTYQRFDADITDVDCGAKCAPHNKDGVPFCCDVRHAVPTLYDFEWAILKEQTILWREWECEDDDFSAEERMKETLRLQDETPENMILAVCRGVAHCEREHRSFTCRQFPFFPYLNSKGELLGITYYWEYKEVCWVVSNLDRVTAEYRDEIVEFYAALFEEMPVELESYGYQSALMRKVYRRKFKRMPLLHRDGKTYLINPWTEKMKEADAAEFEKFGVYQITDEMLFPGER